MRFRRAAVWVGLAVWLLAAAAYGQEYGVADSGEPGDEMIQEYLRREVEKIHGRFLEDVESVEQWEKLRARYKEEYFYMLGLWPLPERTPLKPTVTGSFQGDGFVVEMLHYQSRPGLYVTGNLYRPAAADGSQRLPAVLYVCGHSNQGRDGNKTAYQSHGIWFARHGYVCLVLDTLQLGEIAAIHHGTYREGRWWWHSRGYTPAGVECLNGMRGIDYLADRADVDPERIAVTGISGGGAATFWIAAADERVKVAVPVSGMADLPSYVSNRVINGHCDCMFLYNTFQWPWTRIAGLVAPRPLLFVNSDQDRIFPMDANRRVINRLEMLYRLYGAGDFVDSVVSAGGHAYRQDIRRAAYRFINMHLKDDPRVVADSEVDLVTGTRPNKVYPIPPEKLRVFPADADIPEDELNTTIDEHFVPIARPEAPRPAEFASWKSAVEAELRRVTFRYFPERIPPARLLEQIQTDDAWLETEEGIKVRLQRVKGPGPADPIRRIHLVVENPNSAEPEAAWPEDLHAPGDRVFLLSPRGVGPTRWTRKNPPNYVERSHLLLGRTVDTGRIWDVVATARYLRAEHGPEVPVFVLGSGPAAVLAAYAAACEHQIAGAILNRPPLSHMDADAPQLLNVLRVCDVPDALGLIAPRPLTVYGCRPESLAKTAAIYASAGEPERFVVKME